MHSDLVACYTRPVVRRIRSRRLLKSGLLVIALAALPAQAGLLDWVIDWWNTPPARKQAPPVEKTVRVVGGASG